MRSHSGVFVHPSFRVNSPTLFQHDCEAQGEGELTLKAGDRILVIEEGSDGDWW